MDKRIAISRRTVLFGTGALVAVALLGVVVRSCGGNGSNSNNQVEQAAACSESNAIAVDDLRVTENGFSHSCVKVQLNKIIDFENTDTQPHSLTSRAPNPEQFDVTLPEKDSTWRHAFAAKGSYKIVCKLHEEAEAVTVVVA